MCIRDRIYCEGIAFITNFDRSKCTFEPNPSAPNPNNSLGLCLLRKKAISTSDLRLEGKGLGGFLHDPKKRECDKRSVGDV